MACHDQSLMILLFFGALIFAVESTILTYSSSNGVGLGKCPSGQFECLNSSCINASSQCDGVADCSDGFDEIFCTTGCRLAEYRCPGENKCLPLYTLCDGLEDCKNGEDEICGVQTDSIPCGYNHFICDGECMPSTYLCDGLQHCTNGEDESECGPPTVIDIILSNHSATKGDTVTLTCTSRGYPPPFVSWRRNLEPIRANPRYHLVSSGGVGTLTIDNVQSGDTGDYLCELQSRLYGTIISEEIATVTVFDEIPYVCRGNINEFFDQGEYFYSTRFHASGPATEAAADIIFIVDESGSMAMEHSWIKTEVYLLDQALRERGVGAGVRKNMFSLVGFGRNDFNAIGGITLSTLALANDFVAAASNLQLSGVLEDGYAGIEHAISSVQTRSGTAKQLILITDEDRGLLRPDLTKNVIETRIQDSGFMLNVILNQGYLSDPLNDHSFALGLGADGATYLFNASSTSLFSLFVGGMPNSSPYFSFGNSYEDYATLAHATGGAAWDLNQLREQGRLAEAFTNAFTVVKVQEVMSVLKECLLCICEVPEEYCESNNRNLEQCSGAAEVISVNVVPAITLRTVGSQVNFECVVYPNVSNISISWSYPNGSLISIQSNMLLVAEVTELSEGPYACTVALNSLTFSAEASLRVDRRCKLDDGTYLVHGKSREVLSSLRTNRTADVILLVDESGSMSMEHAWIPDMIKALDLSLQNVGVGITAQNYFGLVGFGGDCINELDIARVLTSSSDELFVTADNISEFTMNLSVGGRQEDGYSALKVAIDSYHFRDGAKLFILITDEDRDVLDANVTRSNLIEAMQNEGIVLNAVVNEEFSGNKYRGLGIDSKANVFIYDPSARSLFRVITGVGSPIPDSAHGSTNTDYTELALELSGAVWDIGQLRQGGSVAEAFTNAFVSNKVIEARAQMEECLKCLCTAGRIMCEAPATRNKTCQSVVAPALPGETPLRIRIEQSATSISPGLELTLYCAVNCSATIHWTFNGADLRANAAVTEISAFSSVLTIVDVLEGNAGVYTCLAQTPSEMYSAVANVKIEFYDPKQDLMLKLTPLEAKFTRGSNNDLVCSVENPAIIEWTFNDGPLPLNALLMDSLTVSILSIRETNNLNGGAYTCTVNDTDRGVINRDTSYVDIVDPVVRVEIERDFFEVALNSSVEIVCRYSSDFPNAIFQWRRTNNLQLPQQAEVLQSSSDIRLLIPSISDKDSGRYVCTGQAGDQIIERSAHVTIKAQEAEYEVFLSPTERIYVGVGSNQSVFCDANKYTKSFRWSFNGLQIQNQGEALLENAAAPINIVAISVSERRSAIVILAANVENSGEYQCLATSIDGSSASASASISVLV